MHSDYRMWIFFSTTTFFITSGWHLSVWASASQMAPFPLPSLSIYSLGFFLAWLAFQNLPRFWLDVGVLKLMGFPHLSMPSVWVAPLPAPSLILGNFLTVSSYPTWLKLPSVPSPLTVSTALYLVIPRRNRPVHTLLTSPCPITWHMHSNRQTEVPPPLQSFTALGFESHSFVYGAFLWFFLFLCCIFLLVKFSHLKTNAISTCNAISQTLTHSSFPALHISWMRVYTHFLSFYLCSPLFNSCSLFGFFPQYLSELLSQWSSMVC